MRVVRTTVTDQDDKFVGWSVVKDTVGSDGFPEVFVYAVVHAAVK